VPGAEIAQYGVATFAVAGIVYIVNLFVKQKNEANISNISKVIENNTKAVEQLVTFLQVALTRQEQKIDELLERARSPK